MNKKRLHHSAAASIIYLALLGMATVPAQNLSVERNRFDITVEAGLPRPGGTGLITVGMFGIGSSGVPNVRFRALESVTTEPPGSPRFLVVTPGRGVTMAFGSAGVGANGAVGMDWEVVRFLAPGLYAAYFRYVVEPPAEGLPGGGWVYLRVRPLPTPVVTGVLNAASFKPAIAPGALVSIFGSNLGPASVSAKFDMFGTYPTALGGCEVLFDGVAAPLLYLERNQINAIVPMEVVGKRSVQVAVKYHSQRSEELEVAVEDTAPGIFTVSQDGNGQGAILHTDLPGFVITVNSAANPVEKGAAIILYATGAGVWSQSVPTGQILLNPAGQPGIRPQARVSLTIGGKTAPLYYAGGAPEMAGVIQVNALVPRDVESGPQVLELKVGENSNLPQQRVTVAVR